MSAMSCVHARFNAVAAARSQHKDVAAELLEKRLKDELKVRSKDNLMQSQEECLCGARTDGLHRH